DPFDPDDNARGQWWGLEATRLTEPGPRGSHALLVQGPGALLLSRGEEGTHLFCPMHGGLVCVQVQVWPVPAGVEPRALLAERRHERQQWQRQLAAGQSSPESDPFRLLPVVRIYHEGAHAVDLRTGLMVCEANWPLHAFVLERLPLPPELLG